MKLARLTARASRETSHRDPPRVEGIGDGDGAAHDLFLCGRTTEDAGDPAGALDLYARALAVSGTGWRPIDTGAVLHRVGLCSSRLGDAESAWEAHLAAGRLIHEDHGLGDLGGVMGEAGLLLVGFRPTVPIRDLITHALLLDAVADAIDQAVAILLDVTLLSREMVVDMHRKLVGLLLLASGASADVILTQAALALYHRLALPLTRHADVRRARVDGPGVVAVAFDALARLYEAVGEQERPERASAPPTFAEVRSLVRLAPISLTGVPDSPIQRWLGPYLRERRHALWATDEALADIRSAG